MNHDFTDIGLNGIRKILDLWRAGKSDSLIDYTQPTRVEPIVLLDADVLFYDSTPEVMQSLLATFSGYYLQAVALSATVGKVEVMRHLDRLNPRRNPIDSGAETAGWLLAQESYKYGLPSAKTVKVAMESANLSLDVMPLRVAMEAKKEEDKRSEFATGKDTLTTVKELSNLSVGKLLSVEITDGQHKATIPVAVRLMASSLPSSSLTHILSIGKKDISMKARWHGWRSGRLEFWRDLVFCQDLIDAHRQNLMNDKDGIYRQILGRKRKNTLAAVLSGNPSVATASNMVVMSKETAEAVELDSNISLANFKMREQLFEPTSLMIMAVISKDYDRVTFYYRGIAEKTEVSVRDLKASNKGNGPDVADILKAYQMGNAPAL